jgi:hypothetical protein
MLILAKKRRFAICLKNCAGIHCFLQVLAGISIIREEGLRRRMTNGKSHVPDPLINSILVFLGYDNCLTRSPKTGVLFVLTVLPPQTLPVLPPNSIC